MYGTYSNIEQTACDQRRDELVAELHALSDHEMNELGIWTDSIESVVDDLVVQMGCPTS